MPITLLGLKYQRPELSWHTILPSDLPPGPLSRPRVHAARAQFPCVCVYVFRRLWVSPGRGGVLRLQPARGGVLEGLEKDDGAGLANGRQGSVSGGALALAFSRGAIRAGAAVCLLHTGRGGGREGGPRVAGRRRPISWPKRTFQASRRTLRRSALVRVEALLYVMGAQPRALPQENKTLARARARV